MCEDLKDVDLDQPSPLIMEWERAMLIIRIKARQDCEELLRSAPSSKKGWFIRETKWAKTLPLSWFFCTTYRKEIKKYLQALDPRFKVMFYQGQEKEFIMEIIE